MTAEPTAPGSGLTAKEAAWYDDFYRCVQVMGPWYYFMIPHLRSVLSTQSRLLELGCGQGHILRYLAEKNLLPQENIYGMDLSQTAVEFVQQQLPRAHLSVGDLYRLEFPPGSFDVCLLMETIEHLEEPVPVLHQIFSVLAPGALLYISFPNFLHLPWLAVRLLSDLLHKPNWIVRQPVDKIYTVVGVVRLIKSAGFAFERGIGSNYGPPVLYPLEKEWMTNLLNKLGLWWVSFHPILVFRKPAAPSGSRQPERTGA
jgi:2-polyprenyl-3-methyl-5-hydroxy-6-metoxy-1,4-benzoquinol methylase